MRGQATDRELRFKEQRDEMLALLRRIATPECVNTSDDARYQLAQVRGNARALVIKIESA
jgi:hypothetical protein